MVFHQVEYPVQKPLVSDRVRVGSWNVYYGDSAQHGDNVIAALKSLDCDVLLLYELNSPLKLPERLRDLGYGVFFVGMNYRKLLSPLEGGIALCSRFPWQSPPRVVETIEDGDFRVRRYYVEARLQVRRDFDLTIGMTHHSLPFESEYPRACRNLYWQVLQHTERYLFGSDLNALPQFRLTRKLRSRIVDLGPPHDRPSHPTGRWVSWCTPKRRIDYMFGTPDLAGMLVGQAHFGPSFPSDHKPIIAELQIPA